MGTQQKELLSIPPSPDGSVFVSDRVSFRTEGTQRVVCVHGVVFAHYGVEDRTAEVYAMITLSESGYASQTQLARSFGYSVRSLRRYQERFEAGCRRFGARTGTTFGPSFRELETTGT